MQIVVQQCGINMFKYFLVYKGVLMVNDDEFFVLFNWFLELGVIVMVYVENGDVVVEFIVKLIVEGNIGLEGYVYLCFSQVEGEVMNCVIMIVDMVGVLFYVVYIFCEEVYEVICCVCQQGKCVWGELLIQYLILDECEYFVDDWDYVVCCVMLFLFWDVWYQELFWVGL